MLRADNQLGRLVRALAAVSPLASGSATRLSLTKALAAVPSPQLPGTKEGRSQQPDRINKRGVLASRRVHWRPIHIGPAIVVTTLLATLSTFTFPHVQATQDVTPPRQPILQFSVADVDSVKFGADGSTLATGILSASGSHGMVKWWEPSDSMGNIVGWWAPEVAHANIYPISQVSGGNAASSMALSQNGHTLAIYTPDTTYSFGGIGLWDLADPAHPRDEAGTFSPVSGVSDNAPALAISPDGRTVVVSLSDGTQDLFDAQALFDGTQHPQIYPAGQIPATNGSMVTALAFSPDSRILAVPDSAGKVRLWDLADLTRPRATLAISDGPPVRSMAFSPDGHTLAVSVDASRTVQLWDLTNTGRPRLTASLSDNGNLTPLLEFSPDGHTLASAAGDAVQLWNVTNPTHATVVSRLAGPHGAKIASLAFSPDSHLLAAAIQGAVSLWDVRQ